MEGPFEVNSPTVNASEIVAEYQRQERIKTICQTVGLALLVGFLIVAVALARRVRTRWPFVTIMLYGIFFVLAVVPALWGVFTWIGQEDFIELSEIPEIYQGLYGGEDGAWIFWLIFAGAIASQACLLIIPVRVTHERPKPRRGIWLTAMGAGFLFSLLVLGMLFAVLSVFSGDDWLDFLNWTFWLVMAGNWLVWLVVFRLFARNTEPQSWHRRVIKWLMRGSILELLIAVPSHIIVRHKDVCCAHMTTAAGLATGLAVMFFAFGPGIYYLYVERIKSKKPNIKPVEPEIEQIPPLQE